MTSHAEDFNTTAEKLDAAANGRVEPCCGRFAETLGFSTHSRVARVHARVVRALHFE